MKNELQQKLLLELYRRANGNYDKYFSASDIANSLEYKTQSVSQSLIRLRTAGYVESMVVCNLSQAQTYWRVSTGAATEINDVIVERQKYKQLKSEWTKLTNQIIIAKEALEELENKYGI